MFKARLMKLAGLLAAGTLCLLPGQGRAQSGVTSGIVAINKTAPPLVALGEQYENTVTVTAIESAGNIVVSDTVPSGASFVSSQPPASKTGNTLTWNITSLKQGASQVIKIRLKAEKEGDFTSCATVSAVPLWCVTTKIGKPRIEISKAGPSSAVVNQPLTYTIVVGNPGNMVAKNVVVTDTIPAGLRHSSGQSTYTWNIGDLAPQQKETRTILLTGTRGGDFCNKVLAKSSNAGQAEAEACTKILVPGLNVDKSGPPMQFLGKRATYTIKVTNSGQTTLNDVVVADTFPAATKLVSTRPQASVLGTRAEWRLPTLAPQAEASFEVVLTTMTPGTHPNSVAVTTREGLNGNDKVPTVWKGISALLITVEDNPDPILVGEETTYTIRVTNQGTHDDTNIRLVGNFDAEVTPLAASNGGSVAGKTVTFPAFPRLAPKQSFTYTIRAKGEKAGDHRLKVVRTSDDIPKPTTAEESTRVF